ncbi:hypothetical protein [Salmonella enterica]
METNGSFADENRNW